MRFMEVPRRLAGRAVKAAVYAFLGVKRTVLTEEEGGLGAGFGWKGCPKNEVTFGHLSLKNDVYFGHERQAGTKPRFEGKDTEACGLQARLGLDAHRLRRFGGPN